MQAAAFQIKKIEQHDNKYRQNIYEKLGGSGHSFAWINITEKKVCEMPQLALFPLCIHKYVIIFFFNQQTLVRRNRGKLQEIRYRLPESRLKIGRINKQW